MAGSWHTVEGLALGGSRAILSHKTGKVVNRSPRARGRASVVKRELLSAPLLFLRGAHAD